MHVSTHWLALSKHKRGMQYKKMYEESINNPEAFWGKIAEEFHWEKKVRPNLCFKQRI